LNTSTDFENTLEVWEAGEEVGDSVANWDIVFEKNGEKSFGGFKLRWCCYWGGEEELDYLEEFDEDEWFDFDEPEIGKLVKRELARFKKKHEKYRICTIRRLCFELPVYAKKWQPIKIR
jgi:hypothetical protein